MTTAKAMPQATAPKMNHAQLELAYEDSLSPDSLPLRLHVLDEHGGQTSGLRIVASDQPGPKEITYQAARKRVAWALETGRAVKILDALGRQVMYAKGSGTLRLTGALVDQFWAAAEEAEYER